MTGRLYMGVNETWAQVVYDECIFAPFHDLNDPLSMNHLRVRFELALEYTAQWSTQIRERFGGVPFSATDYGGAMSLAF